MMTSEREGFNINNNKNGYDVVMDDDDVDDDDDDEFAIDADDLLRMLDEDLADNHSFTPELPTTSFYESTDDTHGSGSAFLGDDQMAAMFPTDYGAGSENSMETVEAMEQLPHTSPPDTVLSEIDHTLFSKYPPETNPFQMPNIAQSQFYPFSHDWTNIYDLNSGFPEQNIFTGSNYNLMSTNEEMTVNMKNKLDNSIPQPSIPCLDTKIDLKPKFGGPEISLHDFFDGRGPEFLTNGTYRPENIEVVNTFNNRSGSTSPDETLTEPCHWTLMGNSPMITIESKREKNNESYIVNGSKLRSFEALDGFSLGSDSTKTQYSGFIGGLPTVFPPHELTKLQQLENNLSQVDLFPELGSSSCYNMNGVESQLGIVNPTPLKGSIEECEGQRDIDESNDLCLIEGASAPPHIHPFSGHGKRSILRHAAFNPQCSTSITPFHHVGSSGMKSRASDERLILQSLVQDLSQPKIEASPPDGSLTVPLLRHQRIALSWMVQKETNIHCSGGILADDQGLGKTVSTIALILSERPTCAKTSKENKQGEPETLDLDEEEDNKQIDNKNISSVIKGRPSAGTLIVCPTSVLRQWAEELANKVTSKGNLSVYVYHGSNRTKDPFELSKYDVVLTTYSIVSMEVPKQPLVRKGGKDKDGRKSELEDDSVQLTKKRKNPSMSEKRRSKKGGENDLVESVSHPLARVGWFRVVLDEAQSIKNHRTRVAQACWGLRAKRRWCLSGTPIQNAIDDLYSYFRFLKYDPYSVYNLFCSMVKNPIQKNPSRGYQKLQAVLKNIMLRRTKGTLLDGKPIITLPPKSIKLKKVEFSEEERDFYSRLEADSRAQFQAYADSGTVKQNYVNILLMLLRLRQACDHPFLVHGYDCSSVLKSSIHTAKKLPQEKQITLLNCLEASLAICGICKDPPEDAVVSLCGHVFCNQCISERFTGDDNQCPTNNCKSEISASYVFSKATLKTCLSDHISENTPHISNSPDQKEGIEPRPASKFESSKIKAALEVLNSLPNSNPHGSKQFSPSEKLNSEIRGVENGKYGAINGSDNTKCVVKEKAIVFSQWTRMLDLLEDCLKESSIQYRRLDGTMSVVARDKAVRDFNTLPEVSVMIMSLKAASLGLNMVAACHVVLLDLWWNPTTEDQAIDRAHRIGQTRPVTVVRLTVKDTVEDRILALQQKKRELVASAFGEDEKGSRQSRLTVEDLTYLFMA